MGAGVDNERGVQGGERLAQPIGFAGELVKSRLDLFTQAIDHVVSTSLESGAAGVVYAGPRHRLGRDTATEGADGRVGGT